MEACCSSRVNALLLVLVFPPLGKVPISQYLAKLISFQTELCINMFGMRADSVVGNSQDVGNLAAAIAHTDKRRDFLFAGERASQEAWY